MGEDVHHRKDGGERGYVSEKLRGADYVIVVVNDCIATGSWKSVGVLSIKRCF